MASSSHGRDSAAVARVERDHACPRPAPRKQSRPIYQLWIPSRWESKEYEGMRSPWGHLIFSFLFFERDRWAKQAPSCGCLLYLVYFTVHCWLSEDVLLAMNWLVYLQCMSWPVCRCSVAENLSPYPMTTRFESNLLRRGYYTRNYLSINISLIFYSIPVTYMSKDI